MIKLVVFSTLYPNSEQPRHGIFVEQRLRHLLSTGLVDVRVVAPIPWFFSKNDRFGRYARLARVARREFRYGISIEHPRYVVIPKVGMTLSPYTLARSAYSTLGRLKAEGFDFDLIDSHYIYPDGVAAAALGRYFKRPVVMTARGTDINIIAGMSIPQRQIRGAMARSDAVITVSGALAEEVTRLELRPKRLLTLRNGVNLDYFSPADRSSIREEMNISGACWLCVGHLIELKGVHIVIQALARVSDVHLIVVGDGPEVDALTRLASELGLSRRVSFVGAKAHDELVHYYNAADALVLASSREGMPNVMLEALACGTAVIGNPVGGIPEVITCPVAGRLMAARDAASIVEAWRSLSGHELSPNGRAGRRAYAEQFGWQATTEGQLALFKDVLAGGGSQKELS